MIDAQDKCMTEYRKIMDVFPVLSTDKERVVISVINKYKEGKAKQEARETLFNSNIRLVLGEASQYQNVIP